MKRIKPKATVKAKRFWNAVHKTAREVQSWPEWKRGGVSVLIADDVSKEKQSSSKRRAQLSSKPHAQ